jgi:hypothetical protein
VGLSVEIRSGGVVVIGLDIMVIVVINEDVKRG